MEKGIPDYCIGRTKKKKIDVKTGEERIKKKPAGRKYHGERGKRET